jgi:hypothetical protein
VTRCVRCLQARRTSGQHSVSVFTSFGPAAYGLVLVSAVLLRASLDGHESCVMRHDSRVMHEPRVAPLRLTMARHEVRLKARGGHA